MIKLLGTLVLLATTERIMRQLESGCRFRPRATFRYFVLYSWVLSLFVGIIEAPHLVSEYLITPELHFVLTIELMAMMILMQLKI
jgi:hypothetical protein